MDIGTLTGQIELDDALSSVLMKLDDLVQKFGDSATSQFKRVQAAGSVMSSSLGKAFAIGITGALLAAGGAAVASSMEISGAMTKIQRSTGATGERLEGLKSDFRAVFSTVPQSAAEVASALTIVSTRLGDVVKSGPEMQALTKSFLDFAEVNSVDVAGAANMVSTLMKALMLDAKGVALVMDKLTMASQQSGASVMELGQGLISGGMALTEMGFGFDKALALFVEFKKVGANITDVTSSLGMALGQLAKSGVTDAGAAFEAMIEKIRTAPTFLDSVRISIETFGAKAGKKLAEEIRFGTYAIDGMVASLQKAGGTIEKVKGVPPLTEQITLLRKAVSLAIEPIGSQLVGAMNNMLPPLISVAQAAAGMISVFSTLPQPIQTSVIALLAMTAAAGPVIGITNKLVDALKYVELQTGLAAAAKVRWAAVVMTVGNSIPVLTARIWLMDTAVKASAASDLIAVGAKASWGAAVFAIGNSVPILTARIWLMDVATKASAATDGIAAAAKLFFGASVFAVGNSVPILTARLWLMNVASRASAIGAGLAAAGTTALGTALLAIQAIPLIALLTALAAALVMVGEAVRKFGEAWRSGGLKEFFAWKDDNFVRRFFGLTEGMKNAANGMDETTAAAEALRYEMSGARLAQDVENMRIAFSKLTEEERKNPEVMNAVGRSLEGLASQNAKLHPELKLALAAHRALEAQRKSEAASADGLAARLQRLKDDAYKPLTVEQKAYIQEADKLNDTTNEMAAATGATERQVKLYVETLKAQKKAGDEAVKATEKQRDALKDLASAAIPLTESQKARIEGWRLEGRSANMMADAIGVSSDAMSDYLERIKNFNEDAAQWVKAHEDMADIAHKLRVELEAKDLAERNDIAAQKGSLQDAQLRALVEFHEKNYQLTLSGTALQLRQLELEKNALLASYKDRYGGTSELYRLMEAEVNKFYQHETDIINKTDSTFIERMKAAGLKTREELRLLAEEAVRDFEMMRAARDNTGQRLPPAAVAAAGVRADVAKVAAGGPLGFDMQAAFVQIGLAAEGMASITKGAAKSFITDMGGMAKAISEVSDKTGLVTVLMGGLEKIIAAKTGGAKTGTGALLTSVVKNITGVGQAIKAGSASFHKWDGDIQLAGKSIKNLGIATDLFTGASTKTEKFASGMASGIAIVQGAMSVWSDTADAATKSQGAFLGSMSGAKAGAAFGPWGAAIGAAGGAVLGFIRSLSAGRRAVKDFAASAIAGGSFDALREKMLVLGAQGDALWIQLTQGTKKGDKAGAQKIIAEITKALEAAEARNKAFNTTLGSTLGLIQKWGGGIPAALRPYLDSLAAGKQLTAENINMLSLLGEEGVVSFAEMSAAAEKYGIDVGGLGEAFQSARMHESWQEIIDDMDMLERGGADMNVVLSGMKDEISALVVESLAFGTEIPANMQPWIDKLFEAGELVDENGEKIEDISGLKFGETLQTSLQNLTDTLKLLIEEFKKVPGVLGAIPRNVDIDVTTTHHTRTEPESSTTPDSSGTPDMAGGGIVRPVYAAGGIEVSSNVLPFKSRGTDTVPAMLTPGERVLTVHQNAIYERKQREGSQPVNETHLTFEEGAIKIITPDVESFRKYIKSKDFTTDLREAAVVNSSGTGTVIRQVAKAS